MGVKVSPSTGLGISSFLPSHCKEEQTIPAKVGDGGSQVVRCEGGAGVGVKVRLGVEGSSEIFMVELEGGGLGGAHIMSKETQRGWLGALAHSGRWTGSRG